MAHVHGAAGAAKAAGAHAMMNHGTGAMGAMMEHAGHMMASMPTHGATLAKGAAATGAAIAATSTTGKGFMSILSKHPLLVFSLGVTAGYLAHKYRKEIIATATRATEQGKDFVLHQKENLEDLVAECKECADDAGGESKA